MKPPTRVWLTYDRKYQRSDVWLTETEALHEQRRDPKLIDVIIYERHSEPADPAIAKWAAEEMQEIAHLYIRACEAQAWLAVS